MKHLTYLACLTLCSCTMLDVNKGTYYTNADNTVTKIDAVNGHITHYESATNLHSPIVRGYGHIALGLGADAVAFGAGGPVMGAGTAAITSIVNRPTSRPIPVTTTKP